MTIKEGFAKIPTFFKWQGKDLKEIGTTFKEGGFKTRISYLIMGLGQLLRGQYVRGIAMLAGQIALLAFIFGFGGQYLVQLGTLGIVGAFSFFFSANYGQIDSLVMNMDRITKYL